jgi:hypothetical protein
VPVGYQSLKVYLGAGAGEYARAKPSRLEIRHCPLMLAAKRKLGEQRKVWEFLSVFLFLTLYLIELYEIFREMWPLPGPTKLFNSLQVIFCAASNSDQRLNQRWAL